MTIRSNTCAGYLRFTSSPAYEGPAAPVQAVAWLSGDALCALACRSVAQLARAPVSKTGGCGFDSLHSCHFSWHFFCIWFFCIWPSFRL